MTAAGDLYGHVVDQALQGKINWPTDTLKLALMGSGYTPNLGTDTHWSDISSNEISGSGYSAGGQALSSVTHVVTAANSWSTSAATTTAYAAGAVVRPASGNGFLYQCVIAGTSGGSPPSWPTVVGETVTDGSVTWVCAGSSISVFSAANVTWNPITVSGVDYGVLYDAQTGVAATEPLIGVVTFATALSATGGTITVPPDPNLGFFYFFTS